MDIHLSADPIKLVPFAWDMSEDQWNALLHDQIEEFPTALSKYGSGDGVYGIVWSMDVCAMIRHSSLDADEPWGIILSLYREENETFTPIDVKFDIPYESQTFEDFKHEFENRMKTALVQYLKNLGLA